MSKKNMSYYRKPIRRRSNSALVGPTVIFADFLLLNLLFFCLIALKGQFVPDFFLTYTKMTVLVMNFSMLIAQFFFRTIVQQRLIRRSHILTNTFRLVVTQVVLMFISIRLLSDGGGLFRFMFVFGTCLYFVIITSRYFEYGFLRILRSHGHNIVTVLFVGNDASLANLYNDLTHSSAMGYKVLGYYADQPMKNAPNHLTYIGDIAALNSMLDELDKDPLLEMGVQELFCSLPHDEGREVRRIMESCDKNVVRFFYVPRTFESYDLNLKIQNYGEKIVYTNHLEPLNRPINRLNKRAFDVCFSFGVCLLLLPIIIIVGIIIKLQSPGPIYFKQKRTGIDGHTFACYKFRSMHVNKDADNVQATKDDPRKFRFGNFMRKTNIDELPQFFNVLIGDMSIVGPRPHMLHHTEVYGNLIEKYMVRHFCKPGITGWAQVTGYRGETQELWQMEQRVQKDIWYIEHWSVWLDIKIILLTIKSVVIPDKHAY